MDMRCVTLAFPLISALPEVYQQHRWKHANHPKLPREWRAQQLEFTERHALRGGHHRHPR